MSVIEVDLQPAAPALTGKTAGTRTLTLEDFWSLKTVSDVRLSPDGVTVAYVVGTYEEDKNKAHSVIWLANLADGSTRRFTAGDTADMQPAWSPDGKQLAFVSARHEGKPQIFIIDTSGGEPRRLTSAKDGATSPVWSPDGKRICYSSAVPSDRQKVPQEVAWMEAHAEVDAATPRLRLQKTLASRFDGRGYIEQRAHLFLIDVEGENEPRQITDGDYDHAGAAWSPDGALISFVANRADDAEHVMSYDIWVMDVESGEMRALTNGKMMSEPPVWSPDGQSLAFYGSPSWLLEGYRDAHLWVVSRNGGDQRDLSGSFDRGHRNVQGDYMWAGGQNIDWAPDSTRVYFTLIDHGDDAVCVADLRTGDVKRVSPPGLDVGGIQCAPNGTLVLLAARPDHPWDVFVMRPDGAVDPLVSTNNALLNNVAVVTPELVTWKGPQGWDIEGWLYLPEGVQSPPLVVHIHGGPYGSWGNNFYFQAQALAGEGYASMYINPRGSIGYGESFSRAADWGEDDFRDVMAGIDTVIAADKVDPKRLAITGISYGGFMTNWAIGHTDRFRAAVSVNGVSNQVSMFGVSDMSALWLPTEFGGAFWESEEAWQRFRHHSPITYVDRMHTPLLLIQSENDYRCPIEQGEQMLTALRYRHQIVELVRFPGASHVIAASGMPHQRYLQWKLALDWFDTYLKPLAEPPTEIEDKGGITVEAPPPVGMK